MSKGTLALYGCGGFGVNIIQTYEADAGKDIPGHAKCFPYYIDTSRSNMDPTIPEERIFTLSDVDGSGKVRKSNHQAISENVRQILQKFQPADFNIIVFSASGGSGSVLGPLLMSEIQKRGHTAVCVVVGSDESGITAQNTLNTLKTLEAMAERNGTPVVMYYEHNEAGRKQSDVDYACRSAIGSLSILVSRENHGLDTQDIANWANYTKSTEVPSRLARLEVFTDNRDAENTLNQPISLASLYESKDTPSTSLMPDYSCVGYPRNKVEYLPLAHFAVTLETVPQIAKSIHARVEELNRSKQARVVHNSLLSNQDSVTDDGMVL